MKPKKTFRVLLILWIAIVCAAIYFQVSFIKTAYNTTVRATEEKIIFFVQHKILTENLSLQNISHPHKNDLLNDGIIVLKSLTMDTDPVVDFEETEIEHLPEIPFAIEMEEIVEGSLKIEDINDVTGGILPTNIIENGVSLSKESVNLLVQELSNTSLKNNRLPDYEVVHLNLGTTEGQSTLISNSDIVIAHPIGLLGIRFHNLNLFVFKKIKNVVAWSVTFIVLMIVCSFWLIQKYLKEKNRLQYKNEAINNLTHELRTPLTIASMALENLSKKTNTEKEKYLAILQNEHQKIKQLSNRILELEELKNVTANPELIQPNKIIEQSVNRFELLMNNEDQIILKLGPPKATIKADKSRFGELVDNLLGNAIKYSQPPREITVTTFYKKHVFILKVADNGLGIPKKFSKKIFQPFFKVPTNNMNAIKGYGLGLSYCKEIITDLGGKITFESQPQKGTVFIIEIPLKGD